MKRNTNFIILKSDTKTSGLLMKVEESIREISGDGKNISK